jgi:hypothetical protein
MKVDQLVEALRRGEPKGSLSPGADLRITQAMRRANAPSAPAMHLAAAAFAALALALSIRAVGPSQHRSIVAAPSAAALDPASDAAIDGEARARIDPLAPGGPRYLP